MNHLALAVTDEGASRSFYERYLGFDARPPHRYPDGVLMLYDAAGFALALGPAEEGFALPAFLHFGKEAQSAADVRVLRERLLADDVPITEWHDEAHYVSVKFRDPDGYVVQVSWEPGTA